ncbi:MAG: class I SAM-dependent methyltransferase [Hyphomonadaceae bacterium]
MTRRQAALLLAAAPLAACGEGEEGERRPLEGTLEWAIAGPWRVEPERDRSRHPYDTLRFWGLEPGMSVLEIYPGLGWWSSILAPYLRHSAGRLIVAEWPAEGASASQRETMAAFRTRFADARTFGEIGHTALSATSGPLTAPGTMDFVLVSRNVHTFMAGGFAEKAFRDFAAALKPGGLLGVEQHRAISTGVQDPLARNGYVQEAYVKALADEAGFDFVAASDVNANPNDDREHPFGVWTLPPTLRTSPLGTPPDPAFDTAPYVAIGESDRMTLKFRKRGGDAPDAEEEEEEPS